MVTAFIRKGLPTHPSAWAEGLIVSSIWAALAVPAAYSIGALAPAGADLAMPALVIMLLSCSLLALYLLSAAIGPTELVFRQTPINVRAQISSVMWRLELLASRLINRLLLLLSFENWKLGFAEGNTRLSAFADL